MKDNHDFDGLGAKNFKVYRDGSVTISGGVRFSNLDDSIPGNDDDDEPVTPPPDKGDG